MTMRLRDHSTAEPLKHSPGERGTVLVTTLFIALLVGIVVGALLIVAKEQNILTTRSKVWTAEIPIAEAGIEEAMTHLNSHPPTWATNGWNYTGTNFVKSRTLGDGYFYTTISSSRPPRIISIGYGRIPLQTNFTHRTVMVMTKVTPPFYGIIAKQRITMSGAGSDSPFVDSFDSEDDKYSTLGKYDPLKRHDQAGVATWSTEKPAIDTGSGMIFGSVATGPGGTVAGTVGDGSWAVANNGQVQDGHFRDDFNMLIEDVKLPAASWVMPGNNGNVLYAYVLGNGDFQFTTGLSLSSKPMLVTGKARLYVTGGDLKIGGSSSIVMAPGATLEIYLAGNGVFGGGGILNGNTTARSLSIYGLPTCKTLKYSGTSELTGRVYAPQADVAVSGSADVFGAFTANSFTCSGNIGIHYDEALGKSSGPEYQIVSWEEL
jgi:hypothetical protein